MPEFTVELSFEYKSTYRVTAETEQEAMDAAEAHDAARHLGCTLAADHTGISVEMVQDRAFADFLDEPRIWDDQGREIVFD